MKLFSLVTMLALCGLGTPILAQSKQAEIALTQASCADLPVLELKRHYIGYTEELEPLGKALERLEYKETIDSCTKMEHQKRRSPVSVDRISFAKGIVALNAQKFDDAVSEFSRARKSRAARSDTLLALAQAQIKAGSCSKAFRNLREALWFNRFESFKRIEALRLLVPIMDKAEITADPEKYRDELKLLE